MIVLATQSDGAHQTEAGQKHGEGFWLRHCRDLNNPDSGRVTAINQTDGLRATFANGDIVHLRPSCNAPELRCYAEADSAARARVLCDACLARVSAM